MNKLLPHGHDEQIDAAELRSDQAELRTDQANSRTEEANMRAQQAENREETLRASELSYRRLFEAARDGILILDVETGRISDVNPFLVELLGFSHADMVGKTVGELSPFKDILSNQTMLERLQKDGYIRYEDLPLQTRDGRHVAVEFVSNVYQAGDKKVIQCNIRDVTAAKKAEARFRRLVDSNAQGVIFWNTKGEITDANDSFLRLVGYTRAELNAGLIDWIALTPSEYTELDQQAIRELAATGICSTYEKEFICKSGSRVPILLGAATFQDNPEEGVCFVLDLTERKKIEQQLRQIQKMESIGTLAGGVAHDFNNILAVIQMQSDILANHSNLSPAQSELVEGINAATQRAATLTRQLLLFSRKETLQLHDLDLNQSINSMTNMLRRILGEDIQTQFKFSLQSLFVHADAGMMDQVLMNLAVNSRDAMPKGGLLVIETSAVDFDETVTAQSADARAGAFVCLSVSDSGCGIPAENLPRIFEPFFTTKEVGKGIGLGLATLFGIIQQHKGWVNVYSEVGQGTTFRIYLPRLVALSPLHQKTQQPALPISLGGKETILLAEDDDFLRASVCNALKQLGYRVFEASNGIKALKVWEQHHKEIQLLVTDLVMPGGITGKDLGERLSQENPKLRVIYVSGYSAEIVSKGFPLEEGVNFLTKPFQARKLAQAIRQSLNALDQTS